MNKYLLLAEMLDDAAKAVRAHLHAQGETFQGVASGFHLNAHNLRTKTHPDALARAEWHALWWLLWAEHRLDERYSGVDVYYDPVDSASFWCFMRGFRARVDMDLGHKVKWVC